MKKHELLEKAMRDYPKGKKIVPPFLKQEYVSTGVFRLDSQNDIEMIDDGIPILLIYTHSSVNEGTWAEIIPENPDRKFIMKSEDGVDLYDGDPYCVAHLSFDGKKWALISFRDDCWYRIQDDTICLDSERFFSTKEAAEKWIEEQNKPRCITIAKESQYPVEVYEKYIRIKCSPSDNHSDNIIIKSEELEQIYSASISLQTF